MPDGGSAHAAAPAMSAHTPAIHRSLTAEGLAVAFVCENLHASAFHSDLTELALRAQTAVGEFAVRGCLRRADVCVCV